MDLSMDEGVPPQEPGKAVDGPDNLGSGIQARGNRDRIKEYPNYEENGRWYHGYRKGLYMYPCDEVEQDRLDIFHKVLSEARLGRLHCAPINSGTRTGNEPDEHGPMTSSDAGPRILDLGCGTGIWTIDVAKQYPNAYVLGVDLVSMQPLNQPSNCEFQAPKDFEDAWSLGENSWDLIHLQMGCGSVSSWPNLYQKVFEHLRAGTGYFEPRPENIILPDQPLYQWYHHLKKATERVTKPITFNQNTIHMLKEAGFVDIEHQMVGLPLNMWPVDKHENRLGRWYNLAFSESVYSLSLGPLARVSNWPVEKIQALANEAKSQAYNKEVHAYNHLHIFTARKPSPQDSAHAALDWLTVTWRDVRSIFRSPRGWICEVSNNRDLWDLALVGGD